MTNKFNNYSYNDFSLALTTGQARHCTLYKRKNMQDIRTKYAE